MAPVSFDGTTATNGSGEVKRPIRIAGCSGGKYQNSMQDTAREPGAGLTQG